MVPLFPLFVMFFITTLAETNRTPFDLPEAEAELVGGYHTEYSGVLFAFFFLAEYNNIFAASAVLVTFFFGGSHFLVYSSFVIFIVKIILIAVVFVFARSFLPRVRYDQLMDLG